jgi:hypothetical protein
MINININCTIDFMGSDEQEKPQQAPIKEELTFENTIDQFIVFRSKNPKQKIGWKDKVLALNVGVQNKTIVFGEVYLSNNCVHVAEYSILAGRTIDYEILETIIINSFIDDSKEKK